MEINGYEIKPFANLRYADLPGADLRNADLTGADLQDANFTNANVTGTILEKDSQDDKARIKELEEENKKLKEALKALLDT